MNEPSSSVRALSRHVIDVELARFHPDQFGEGIEHAFAKLREVLSPLVGQVGVQAVLERALHLTVPSHRWLAPFDASDSGTGSARVSRWPEILEAQPDPREARECAVELFGQAVAVLCSFIGEDLTLRLIGRTWPRVPERSGSGSQEA